jgi:hypothetical protein
MRSERIVRKIDRFLFASACFRQSGTIFRGTGSCTCAELIVRGKRVPPPPGHDCDYVRERNVLIPEAEKIVSFVEVVPPSEDESRAAWTLLLNGHVFSSPALRANCLRST